MSVRKTVWDTVAISLTNVVRLSAQFVAVPVLARILSPSDYGLVAMSMPFVLFGMMLADSGIGMSLVRTPPNKRVEWSTSFWLSGLLGFFLAAIMAGSAPIMAYLFNEPKLTPIIMTLVIVIIVQAICAIPGAALQQQQEFRIIAIIDIVATMASIGAAVLIALNGGNAWALVGQQLTLYVVRTVLTLWATPFRPLMIFDLKGLKEHLLFSRDVLSVNVLGFLTRSMDNLVIGKVLATTALGVYSMAFQFARLPAMLVSGPLQYVLYAQLAQFKENKNAIRDTFLILTRILGIIIFPSMGMIAVAYHPVFTLLLSAKWAHSGAIFMLIAASCALQAVTSLFGTVRMVLGRTDYQLRATVESGVIWLLGLFASVRFGLEWVAIAYNVIFICYTPRAMALTLPLIECPSSSYLRTMTAPVVATCICIMSYQILLECLPFSEWQRLCLAIVLAIIGIGSSGFTQREAIWSEVRLLRGNVIGI